MNFDEMINNENAKKEEKYKRERMVVSREIAVISCGGSVIGRMGALNKSIPFYEPNLYMFMRFGYKFYYGYGDRGPLTYNPNSYDVSYKGDGKYDVSKSGPRVIDGIHHRFHVAVFGFIDEGAIKNVDRFRELFNEADNSLTKYRNAIVNSNDEKYKRDLKKAFYEKIDGLAIQAQSECGIVEVETMEKIYAGIRKACRTEKSKGSSEAKREFLGEAPIGKDRKGEEGIPPNLIIALIIVGIALLAAILLI